mgnify:FL=1|jgi:hypothetical protein|nr:MAG TPA: hypothetical protein [Caudoviricetes sp.]
MSQGYARITGKVVGPEGLGRMGSVEFTPLPQYKGVEVDSTNALIAHYAAGRLRPDGVLVGHDEQPYLHIAAPHALPDGEYNYRVCVNIPGDTGLTRCVNARIIAGTEVDLVDILAGRAIEDPSDRDGRRVRDIGDGTLEAINPADVIEVGDGVLAWRTNG